MVSSPSERKAPRVRFKNNSRPAYTVERFLSYLGNCQESCLRNQGQARAAAHSATEYCWRGGGIPRTHLLNELCHNVEIQLRDLASCIGDEATVEILVCVGRPAEAIVEMAMRLEADTIIMRMHSHRKWLKWLHRNTALNVARQAPCKVWLVSQGKHAETINLMMVDHTSVSQLSQRVALHEGQNPFRTLLRSPFS